MRTFSSDALPELLCVRELHLVRLQEVDVDVEAAAPAVRDGLYEFGVGFAAAVGGWWVDE